ncbi:allophanate hydrolase subunit 1 [Deinococcus cavernae]|uniref:Allophanate hydrolase subunit 1 n=1 Tax=Deinococcus cavernae TaxID=2320857 RepID=A0A418V5I9_9DEIO|nr:allophanate hydrolase subunit 1 [Deinococcus cavernae]RJF71358.1 allophanate hydrolase subunit 1 [Deinococcus cavernae]
MTGNAVTGDTGASDAGTSGTVAGDVAGFAPLGDSALTVSTPLARELLLSCQAAPLSGVLEAVPALNVVTLLFSPLETTATELRDAVQARLSTLSPLPVGEGRALHLPVRFGGPDLAWCADFTGQTVDRFVDELCSLPLTVAFLGYTPGFAFLTGLPAHLQMPRLSAPRERVPAGSVALGGPWAGVYPTETPGGWRIVGSADVKLFDLTRADPVWWHPGDSVRFSRE